MPDTVIVSPPNNQAVVSPLQVQPVFPQNNSVISAPICQAALEGVSAGCVFSPPNNQVIAASEEFGIWPAVAPGPEYKRSYSYKTGTLTLPTTPQAYGQEYEDVNGVMWQCFAGDTTWQIVNRVAPGAGG